MEEAARKWADEFRQWHELTADNPKILVDHRVDLHKLGAPILKEVAAVQESTKGTVRRVKVIPHLWTEDQNFSSVDILFEFASEQLSFCQIYDTQTLAMIEMCRIPSPA